jgi:hypothetical protein
MASNCPVIASLENIRMIDREGWRQSAVAENEPALSDAADAIVNAFMWSFPMFMTVTDKGQF